MTKNLTKIKVKARNVTPTNEQMLEYKQNVGRLTSRNTNLRFGKLVVLSDQDLDG